MLKVISRSTFDLRTVLDTLLRSAGHLCDADQGTITQRKGDNFYRSVAYGFPDEFLEYVKNTPVEAARNTGTGRALVEGKVIHIPDVHNDPEFDWPEAVKLGGFRTMLGVPMLREGTPVGVLTLTRKDIRPFTKRRRSSGLVATFADQAAIAIENQLLAEAVVEFGMNVQQAVEAANVNSYQMRSSFDDHRSEPGRLVLQDATPPWVRAELARMGYRIETERLTSGPINAIYFDWARGSFWGGASNYGEDYGIAW